MKSLVKTAVLVGILSFPGSLLAQKDSIHLQCPLNEATVVPPPKNVMKFDITDLCVVFVSVPDTAVKAVVTGRVTNTEYTDESKNGVVLYAKMNGKDYYFWYVGLNKLLVKRNDLVKAGQPIGYISQGDKVELTMYDFETPVDILKYLDCKSVLK